jgi:hypothetical protein
VVSREADLARSDRFPYGVNLGSTGIPEPTTAEEKAELVEAFESQVKRGLPLTKNLPH